MPFWHPGGPPALDEILTLAALSAQPRILSIGCGPAAVLCHVVEATGGSGLGVDVSGDALALAKTAVAKRGLEARVELLEGEFLKLQRAEERFDLAMCIGSSAAFGTPTDAMDGLRGLVASGGYALLGEGYWQKRPSPEYLEFLGGDETVYASHDQTGSQLEAAGWEVVATREVTQDEWDSYEDTYATNIEAFVRANPDDPDAPAMLARIRRWRDAYLKWGRGTLGFGLYLARRGSGQVSPGPA